jgi:hypothetical protein
LVFGAEMADNTNDVVDTLATAYTDGTEFFLVAKVASDGVHTVHINDWSDAGAKTRTGT